MKSSTRYLFVDVETGGLHKEASLLTLYCLITDKDLNPIDSLDLKIKSKEYNISADALKINKINLLEHDASAKTKAISRNDLLNFLIKNRTNEKYILVGHNVRFDIACINEQLLEQNTWEDYVSYRTLDTVSIARFMQQLDRLPESLSLSLASLAKHFDINLGTMHNAEVDVKCAVEVYRKFLNIFGHMQS